MQSAAMYYLLSLWFKTCISTIRECSSPEQLKLYTFSIHNSSCMQPSQPKTLLDIGLKTQAS